MGHHIPWPNLRIKTEQSSYKPLTSVLLHPHVFAPSHQLSMAASWLWNTATVLLPTAWKVFIWCWRHCQAFVQTAVVNWLLLASREDPCVMPRSKHGADTPTELPLHSGMGKCSGSIASAESHRPAKPCVAHLSTPITFSLWSYNRRRFQPFNEREGV